MSERSVEFVLGGRTRHQLVLVRGRRCRFELPPQTQLDRNSCQYVGPLFRLDCGSDLVGEFVGDGRADVGGWSPKSRIDEA